MVMKNEADRYLDCSLKWHKSILDAIHVYDDRSSDGSVAMARRAGCHVSTRVSGPSFLEHEGHFRQNGWRAFEEAMRPTEDDWVLAIDADEFLVSRTDEIDALYRACVEGNELGLVARRIQIPEVFAVTESDQRELTQPQVRLDGFWGSIAGTRLFRYRYGGVFSERAMGSGSEPTYVAQSGAWGELVGGLFLMHYGYAFPEDQQAKYDRYSVRTGHADTHVASIVQPPSLVRWDGPAIDVWRGVRSSVDL